MSSTQSSEVGPVAVPSISTFLTNVHLLDLDRRDDWPAISPQTFTRKNTLQNEKTRVHCVEWALYRLFEIWDPEATQNKLQPFFPALVPLQSLNLRAALFRCLNDLKKNDVFGKEVILRKTMFDDCKGEKLQDLLASFSSLVLRKVLADGQGGKASIAGRLAIAKKLTVQEHQSYLPLAIAHRASLTALLRRKRDLRVRYQGFGKMLSVKEQELDRRFEAVVRTQDLLDANPIPDHTVSRVSKLFEKHWQGDANFMMNTVIRGKRQDSKDSLLDEPFSNIWSKISDGTFDGSENLSSSGLLQELEKRVANQEARLNQWRGFKEAMKTDVKPSVGRNVQSPTMARAKSNMPDLQSQRDLVFSPRKSPRKSERGVVGFDCMESPTPSMAIVTAIATKHDDMGAPTPSNKNLKYETRAGANGHVCEDTEEQHNSRMSLTDTSVTGSDNSGFSEAPSGHLYYADQPQDARRASSSHQNENEKMAYRMGNSHTAIGGRKPDDSETVEQSKDIDEDDLLAQKIISTTLNAAPTPIKPKLSLIERTRQSILASSSPSGAQKSTAEDASPHPQPLSAIAESRDSPSSHPPNSKTDLLERTRQSIALVPARRATTHDHHPHRTSKIYPTNQFETPRKQTQQTRQFVTPPEELFSPGAGYDSVFKSRPKVGFSPVGTPGFGASDFGLEEKRDVGDGDGDGDGNEALRVESPLGRAKG